MWHVDHAFWLWHIASLTRKRIRKIPHSTSPVSTGWVNSNSMRFYIFRQYSSFRLYALPHLLHILLLPRNNIHTLQKSYIFWHISNILKFPILESKLSSFGPYPLKGLPLKYLHFLTCLLISHFIYLPRKLEISTCHLPNLYFSSAGTSESFSNSTSTLPFQATFATVFFFVSSWLGCASRFTPWFPLLWT